MVLTSTRGTISGLPISPCPIGSMNHTASGTTCNLLTHVTLAQISCYSDRTSGSGCCGVTRSTTRCIVSGRGTLGMSLCSAPSRIFSPSGGGAGGRTVFIIARSARSSLGVRTGGPGHVRVCFRTDCSTETNVIRSCRCKGSGGTGSNDVTVVPAHCLLRLCGRGVSTHCGT